MNKILEFPGLIDCHVHFREPGYEHRGTMATEASAARAGGVLTVCDMPNTNLPTVTIAALEDKIRRAGNVKDCDIRFFFGATEMAHLREFERAWSSSQLRPHLVGLKLYLDHSTGNQKAESNVVEAAFRLCAKLRAPIVAHCEDPEINAACFPLRPPQSETKAVSDAIALARKYGTHLHVAHLSTASGLELVRSAKRDGLSVTCEVAPHHLFLTVDDDITLGTLGKMNPPLRGKADRDALWVGIADGIVDCIATDHAPHTLEEKHAWESHPGTGALDAPSGVPGVETMLPLLLSVASGHWPHPTAAKPPAPVLKLFSYSVIRKLCFENPNRIFSLGASDVPRIHIDPNAEWTIRGENLHAKCGWTPYEGWKVRGKVVQL